MLNMEPQPDILNLLNKLQESTTKNIDEERGSFKKGDKVTYDMFGSGLTNSDLIRTLDTNEHAIRVIHNGTVAKIVETIGEEVSRYSIMFEDGFIINDVAVSELKSVKEVEEGDMSFEEIKAEVITTVKNMRKHTNEWSVRDSLKKFTSWGFWKKGEMASVDVEIAGEIADDLLDYIQMAPEQDIEDVYDIVHHYVSLTYESKTNEAEESKIDEMRPSATKIAQELFSKQIGELTAEEKAEVKQVMADQKLKSSLPASPGAKVDEAEDATDTMKPQEKPNINAEDYHMEDYSEEDLNKPDAKVKSKSEETGNAIRPVEDDELEQKEDKVVTPKKESKLKEQKHSSDNLTIGDTVKVLSGRYKGEEGEVQDVMSPDEDPEEMPEGQFDVKMSDGKTIYLGWDDVKLVESKLKEEETEFTPSRSEVSKISDEKLRKLYNNALRYLKYWEKDGTVPGKVERMRKAVERWEEILSDRGLISKDDSSEKKESKFSFMKKQDPLWLCNECFTTFRNNRPVCTLCESKEVEKIAEQFGPGFTKEVFQVTWNDTDTGKEESTRVMAFDKPDAEKEAGRSNREITKVEGPITKEAKKEEDKVPFDESSEGSNLSELEDIVDGILQDKYPGMGVAEVLDALVGQHGSLTSEERTKIKVYIADVIDESKLHEHVRELVGEIPGIDAEERARLYQALDDGDISDEWPENEDMIDALSTKNVQMGAADLDDLDMGEIKFVYLKYILLPRARKATAAPLASESKIDEQEEEGIPEKGKTYLIHQKLGIGLLKGTYEVTNVEYRKTEGNWAKQFQVANDDEWWIAKFYGFKEVASESKVDEQEDWDLSFMYAHNLIWHNPLVDHKGTYFIWQKQRIAGKKVRVFTDYQADWVERNRAIPVKVDYEPISEVKKEVPTSTSIEIVRSKIDSDAYVFRAVELPSGDSVNLSTSEGSEKEVLKKGKDIARSLGAEFLGIVDESKLKEQEEDTFKTVAAGIVDRADADKLAGEKEGQVVADEDDEKKFAVIVKEE